MKTLKIILIAVLVIALSLVGAGCYFKPKETDGFSPSKGILDTGFFDGIRALDYVDLPKYEGIPVPRDVHEVTDEAIQAEIDSIMNRFATTKEIYDRAIVDGDAVNIDYVGRVDGIAFDGGSTGGSGTDVTIGVTAYIDDFLEQLIGHKPGDAFDIEVTFPEDYSNEELAGKDAVFATTVNYIVEKTYPELTDKFVKDELSPTYGWKTVAQMKTDIEDSLRGTAVGEFVRDYLIENAVVNDVPEKLLEYQRGSLVYYYQNYADSYGMRLEDFLASYAGVATVDELLLSTVEQTRESASFHLIMQAIAEDAGIRVSANDVADYYVKLVGAETYAKYAQTYGLPYLKFVVLGQKVIDYLADKVVVVDN